VQPPTDKQFSDVFGADVGRLDLSMPGQVQTSALPGPPRVVCGVHHGQVTVQFPKGVEWVGFTAEQAERLASTLQRLASQLRKASKKR
jgi:hypothetical protein